MTWPACDAHSLMGLVLCIRSICSIRCQAPFPVSSSFIHSLFARTIGLGRSALVPYQGYQRRDTRLLE